MLSSAEVLDELDHKLLGEVTEGRILFLFYWMDL